MRLTKQTDYAIRLLVYCSATGKRLSTTGEIARTYKVSELFLAKIIKLLTDAGMVTAVRGRNGGIRLAKNPADISILSVVQITESDFEMAECFGDNLSKCLLIDGCVLNSVLSEALAAFFQVLESYSIKDLSSSHSGITELFNIQDLKPLPLRASL